MPIPRSFIEQLLLHCDVEDVISTYVPIKREGKNKKGLCPFHSEKTPSMVIYPDTQSFYCFGCGAGGDVISFIMRIENLSYVEAVKLLAQRAGMEVPEDELDDRMGRLKARVLEINRAAARFYHGCLKQPVGVVGLQYLRGTRQLSERTITQYGLGFAPNSWDALLKHLRGKGYTLEELDAAKVITKGKSGKYFDFFRNRVIFPVIDLRGNVIAFGGRVMDDSKPKYLNTSDTPVFKKSRNLFSLNFAKNAGTGRLILAEGYMDVIAIHAAGFQDVVATLGTALTAEQARLISTYAKEVLIAYDSDGAGQTAIHRAINLLSEVSVTTKTIKMEGAKDPDEYIKKFGAKRFELLLNNAGNVVEFELNKAKAELDLKNPGDRVEYLKRAVAVLANIQNRMEREVYAGNVAMETNVTVQTVCAQVDALVKKRRRNEEKREWQEIRQNPEVAKDRINPDRAKFYLEAQAEEGIIAGVFKNPDYLKMILSKITAEDFVTEFNRRVFESLVQLLESTAEQPHISLLLQNFSQEEQSRITQILARNQGITVTGQLLGDYVAVLQQHKDSLKGKDVGAFSMEELERRRRNLSKR